METVQISVIVQLMHDLTVSQLPTKRLSSRTPLVRAYREGKLFCVPKETYIQRKEIVVSKTTIKDRKLRNAAFIMANENG